MKRTFIMGFGVILMAFNLYAQDLTIGKFPAGESPVIDGTLDAIWDLIVEVPFELDDPDDYGPTTVFNCYFKMGCDDEALYLMLHREDDDFANQWETGLSDWQSDRDEIFFDVNINEVQDRRGATNSQNGASYGHYQFTSIWVKDMVEWNGSPSQWYHNAPFTFGYLFASDDEYDTEYRFPFTSLTINTDSLPDAEETFPGGNGIIFGLVITIADVDMADEPVNETYRKFMRWVDEGGWDTMDDAGKVLMSNQTVSGIKSPVAASGIIAYPNPARNSIRLANLQHEVNIVIYDVAGRVILRQDHVLTDQLFDISPLHAGTYCIKMNGEGKSIIFSKL